MILRSEIGHPRFERNTKDNQILQILKAVKFMLLAMDDVMYVMIPRGVPIVTSGLQCIGHPTLQGWVLRRQIRLQPACLVRSAID
jgi:hypothetical protein